MRIRNITYRSTKCKNSTFIQEKTRIYSKAFEILDVIVISVHEKIELYAQYSTVYYS